MNTIDELIEVLQGVKAGRRWGYRDTMKCALYSPDSQSIRSLTTTLIDCRIELMPEFILCNGIEIPAPLRVVPEKYARYWVASAGASSFCTHWIWQAERYDTEKLERGIIHATEAAAAAHGRAMCGVKA